MTAQVISTLILIVFALLVIFVRLKASQYPTSARKILIPPLGMSTGFLMFLVPQTRVPLTWAVIAFLCGCLLSYPLILTSRMYKEKGKVYLKRSKGFVVILLVLLVVRLLLRQYIDQYVSVPKTGGLFFIFAFGMILPWRLVMYRNYRKLVNALAAESDSLPSVKKV